MKLLLDENLPIKLKKIFKRNHLVLTVRDLGWSGKKNGELLQLMSSSGFDALMTIDKNIRYQQDLDQFEIKVVILNAEDNKLSTLGPFVKKFELLAANPITEKIVIIDVS